MRWFSGLPPHSITSFVDLAAAFESQFTANKTKRLEGLHINPFSDSLALSHPANMIEIRALVEKHVEVVEDKEDRLLEEKELPIVGKKITLGVQAHQHYNLGGAGHSENERPKTRELPERDSSQTPGRNRGAILETVGRNCPGHLRPVRGSQLRLFKAKSKTHKR
ncbi:hypothetical protein CR513_16810, partial [Mucuna pruriens]